MFNTAELLETVLLNLPTKDLLLSQRVCRSWQALILTSLHLQRALFLLPTACGNLSYIDWRLDDKGLYEDSGAQLDLGEHLRGPSRDQPPKAYESHWGQTRDDAGQYRVYVNPLLSSCFPVLTRGGVYWQEKLEDLPEPLQRAEASWRTMFFTQPPINCAVIEWDSEEMVDSMGAWTVTVASKIPETAGLTMECLLLRLTEIGRPAWLWGGGEFRVWEGAEDLERVVVRGRS